MMDMRKKHPGAAKVAPYCYIAPITLILVTFVIGSVIGSIILSFTKYNIMTEPIFQGSKNYVKLMSDIKFIKALKNTLGLVVLIVPLQTVLGVVISVFLVANRHRFLGKLANSVVFIPVICAPAVAGVVWRELLNGKIEIVEKFFGLFGIQPSMLLGNARTALITVGMVAIWKWMGYYVVIYTSGLLAIPDTYYEAAKVDGAGKVRCFLSITVPLLRPTIILGIFLSMASSLQCFDLIFNLTGGGPNNASTTLVVYAYSKCFGSGDAGYAMAISNILFVVILAVALLQRDMMKRKTSEVS